MTNSKLTNAQLLDPPAGTVLYGIDKQKRFLLQQARMQLESACGHNMTQMQAAGQTVEEYDVVHGSDREYRCPECGAKLIYVLPLFGPARFALAEPLTPEQVQAMEGAEP